MVERDDDGIAISAAFHETVVGPLLATHRPALEYAAARLGSGSDVLGLDDATSRDHDWGLRLTLLVDESATHDVDELLAATLPDRFRELPVRFPVSWDETVAHRVEVADPAAFLVSASASTRPVRCTGATG